MISKLFVVFCIFLYTPLSQAASLQQPFTSLQLTLHTENREINGPLIVQFGLPIPPDVQLNPEDLRLLSGDQALPLTIYVLSYWPDTFAPQRIRALLVSTQLQSLKSVPKFLSLTAVAHQQANKPLPVLKIDEFPPDVTHRWDKVELSAEYPRPFGLMEPRVYVTLPAAWLTKSLLKTYSKPFYTDAAFFWFDKTAELYGKTAVNAVSSAKLKKIDLENGEPWMYDRVANLYHLYIRSGDIKWLRHAHQAAQFYALHINKRGLLKLNRTCDLKCSYAQGLWLDYLMMGDKNQLPVIKRIEAAAKRWAPAYAINRGFFTERHQSYAFWALLTAWEAFPEDRNRLHRVRSFFEQIFLGITQPPQAWSEIGCYQHGYKAHEGEGNNHPICSPWMTALLAEAIWKYYLLTDDQRALQLLSRFGDYMVNYATYKGSIKTTSRHYQGWLPWYIAGHDYHTKKRPEHDIQHSCDISGVLARAIWSKRKLGLDATDSLSRFQQLLLSCKEDVTLGRSLNSLADTQQNWPIGPYRKYNWAFGSTHDMSWLMDTNTDL